MSVDSEHQDQHRDNERFVVRDGASANWVIRKVVEARAYRERVKRWAEIEIARSHRDEERLLYLFGRQLEDWARIEVERRGGRTRSLSLPAGKVGFRRRKPLLVIEDDAKVIAWAKAACPSAVMMIERLSKSALMAHVEATGELPPDGARLEGGGERFSFA